MNNKYLDNEDYVNFKIESKIGINTEIMLPLSLVEDLKEHVDAFDGVVTYPINSVVFHALCVYMDYVKAELVRFDSVKPFIDKAVDVDLQEMVVE